VPEGDSIHSAARRVGAALVGKPIVAIETPQPRHSLDRWPERLGGRAVRSVDARGKHLFIRFDGDLTLHSHLRMTGHWGVYRRGQRWRRSVRRAWLVLRTEQHEVVEFDGPVLELMTDSRSRFDRRLATLGPDVLDEELDERRFVELVRRDDQARAVGDALLDQRNLAGVGNMWKAEGCFVAGVDPWRALRELSDEELLAIVRAVRPPMLASAEGRRPQRRWVYGRAGQPCRRCATPIRARGQGDDNRTTYWCPTCQA
jgi:endonuclease-8